LGFFCRTLVDFTYFHCRATLNAGGFLTLSTLQRFNTLPPRSRAAYVTEPPEGLIPPSATSPGPWQPETCHTMPDLSKIYCSYFADAPPCFPRHRASVRPPTVKGARLPLKFEV
jgi:hypothetical protein